MLDYIFPKSCVVCQKMGRDLCMDCEHQFKKIGSSYCCYCGQPFLDLVGSHPCSSCQNDKPYYDKHRSLFKFNEPIKKLIHGYKYHSQFWVRSFFLRYLTELQGEFRDADMILPIPLHVARLRKRGFNQSLLLAKSWGYVLNKTVDSSVLVRIKNTPSQTGLNKKERLMNLKDAFQVIHGHKLESKNILLVDDVRTTGVTLNVASQILKQNGANKVYTTSLAFVG